MLLDVRDLSISFNTFRGKINVLDNVSFQVEKGEILSIVGESGSGKSVAAYSTLRLLDKNANIEGGEILFKNTDLIKIPPREIKKYRGKEIAMIFQEPMTALHPTMRIKKQLINVIKRHRDISKEESYKVMLNILKDVHFENPNEIAEKYPHELSGGMRQRIVIALAMAGLPELLIADEPTTALDVTIQKEILNLIRELIKKHNTAVVLITHDIGVVSEISDKVSVMYAGKILEGGKTEEVLKNPKHPYTKALLNALPDNISKEVKLKEIPGEVPDLKIRPKGCIFSSRCDYKTKRCLKESPLEKNISESHFVSCWEVVSSYEAST